MNCPCTGGMPHCGNKECEDLCCGCINLALKVAYTEAGQGEELKTELREVHSKIRDNCPN